MKKLLHNSKIKIAHKKSGLFHYGYIFSNDIDCVYSGILERKDRNHSDDGKIFILQESTCVDGIAKDRSEYRELEIGETVYFGDVKMQVKWIGDYSDMGRLEKVEEPFSCDIDNPEHDGPTWG